MSDLFLPQRFSWTSRVIGLPKEPKTGDLGPVRDALFEVTDAAGGLEYSRGQLGRAIAVAQEEFDVARKGLPDLGAVDSWGGRNTPPVYYEFCNAAAWTRTVKDRYEDRLLPAVRHDAELVIRLQKIRAGANAELEDARRLAQCGLHKYTPPYPLAGAKPVGGQLTYPVPIITNANNFRANLGNMPAGRHAASLVEGFWAAVNHLINGLLDVFYPE